MQIVNSEAAEPVVVAEDNSIVTYGHYTCIGGRAENQDCLGTHTAHGWQILIVCDGMGGHAGGRVASETAVRTLIETLEAQPDDTLPPDAIKTAVEAANKAIFDRAAEDRSLRGMGTALGLLLIAPDGAYVTHIGDTRVYQLRGGEKAFRTFDDSMVFEQVRVGRLTEEEARQHPRSNVLTRALGIQAEVEVTVDTLDYCAGDRFVLCCDGIWNGQPEPDFLKLVTEHESLKDTLDAVYKSVDTIGQEAGAHHDNHTIIVADLLEDMAPKPSTNFFKRLLSKIFG